MMVKAGTAQRKFLMTEVYRLDYRPEIDGLRSIAVVPVILFHAGLPLFSGGYVGVDVFFVISGYLITTLLMNDLQQDRFSIYDFYMRRGRRILPALITVMVSCIPFAWLWMTPSQFNNFTDSLVAVTLFVSNFYFFAQSGYFETEAELSPLLHTWSLSVEEQFYVLFPLLLAALFRTRRSAIAPTLIVLAALSLLLSQWLAPRYPDAAFYISPTRVWELAVGCLCALIARRYDIPVLALVGLALICFGVFAYDAETPWPSLYTLAPVVGTALVVLCCRSGPAFRLLSAPMMVWTGKLSYSAYLWHFPLFAFHRIRFGEVELPAAGAIVLLTFALAALTWRFVEQPFRNRNSTGFYSLRSLLAISIGVTLVFPVLNLANREFGLQHASYFYLLSEDGRKAYRISRRHTGYDFVAAMRDDGACRFWTADFDEAAIGRFRSCAATHGKATVILGDSHAMNIFNMYFHGSDASFVVGVVKPGCRLDRPNAACPYGRFAEFAQANAASIGEIVFHQSGSHMLLDADGNSDTQLTFDRPDRTRFSVDSFEAADRYLTGLSRFNRVTWLGPFPEVRIRVEDPGALVEAGLRIPSSRLALFDRLERELSGLAAADRPYRYVSLFERLDVQPEDLVIGDCLTFRDKDHWSSCGEEIFADRYFDAK